jgi:hypothetical protein
MSATEPRWLDRLARRRAARRDRERGRAIRVVDGGLSRRTVVATGAAVALGVAGRSGRPPRRGPMACPTASRASAS